MTVSVFLYLTFIVFMSAEGLREGFYFHYINIAGGKPTIEHKIFTASRILMFSSCLLTCNFATSNIEVVAFLGLCMALSSPFWHDGFYYSKRNDLDRNMYKKRFFDQSTSSTALLTKFCTPILRTLYFLFSLIIFIIFVIVK